MGRFKDAKLIYEQALVTLLSAPKSFEPSLIDVENNLLHTYKQLGETAKAEKLHARIDKRCKKPT